MCQVMPRGVKPRENPPKKKKHENSNPLRNARREDLQSHSRPGACQVSTMPCPFDMMSDPLALSPSFLHPDREGRVLEAGHGEIIRLLEVP